MRVVELPRHKPNGPGKMLWHLIEKCLPLLHHLGGECQIQINVLTKDIIAAMSL